MGYAKTVLVMIGLILLSTTVLPDAANAQRVKVPLRPVEYRGQNASVISLVQSANQLLVQCHRTGNMNVRGAQQVIRSAERLAVSLLRSGLEDQDMPAVRDAVQYLWLAQYNCGGI